MFWLLAAGVRLFAVGSTSRCNTGVKSLRWGFECQSLTWPFVELTSYFVQISLRMRGQTNGPKVARSAGGDRDDLVDTPALRGGHLVRHGGLLRRQRLGHSFCASLYDGKSEHRWEHHEVCRARRSGQQLRPRRTTVCAARPQNRAHTITKNNTVGNLIFGKFQKAPGSPALWHSEGLSGHPVSISPG